MSDAEQNSGLYNRSVLCLCTVPSDAFVLFHLMLLGVVELSSIVQNFRHDLSVAYIRDWKLNTDLLVGI